MGNNERALKVGENSKSFPTVNLIFLVETITLFKFITMLCGIDNIPWNNPSGGSLSVFWYRHLR